MNVFRRQRAIAAAERIVADDLDCDWIDAELATMHRCFRKILDAGGNEYDAALGFTLTMIQERLDLIDAMLPKTVLWKSASDSQDVLAQTRLRAAWNPLAKLVAP